MRSISKAADEAMDQVKDTASQAKGSLLDFGTQALKFINNLRVMEMRAADGLLDRVGLQRRESSLRPVMWFAAGGLAAGAVALVLAPVAGKDLRARISRMFDDGVEKAKEGVEKAKEVEAKLEDAVADAKKTVAQTVSHATGAAESKVANGLDDLKRSTTSTIQKNDHLR